jgi:phosphate transport system substrate-binding protein
VVTLNAGGATFPAPLYQKWFESFQQREPNLQVKYNAVGSDAGIRLLQDGHLDFAASDVPLTNAQANDTKILHFPTVLGAVVPIYNLPGEESSLQFTGEVLAEIYLGTIKKWNDPKIRQWNRGVRLPDKDIAVVHRSDGSGTSFVWTDYLSKVSAKWKTDLGAHAVLTWPVGIGAQGNEAVATMVQQTSYSIGYVELVYALRQHLPFGAVQNSSGQFVQADLASAIAAARNAGSAMNSDFRISITDAPGKDAYPITSFTWWLLPAEREATDKKAAFAELLQWALTSGQKECASLGYAPLPREVANRELDFLRSLK